MAVGSVVYRTLGTESPTPQSRKPRDATEYHYLRSYKMLDVSERHGLGGLLQQPAYGWGGVLRGTTMAFFGFIGFDEVCKEGFFCENKNNSFL